MSLMSMVQRLVGEDLRVVVVGGLAASLHGSAILTNDLDVCYDPEEQNLRRLSAILTEWGAYPRGWPPGLPFYMDARTFRTTPTFTLTTREGDIDLLHRVEPIGDYAACAAAAVPVPAFGVVVPTLRLGAVIRAKRFANRPKDLAALPELEAVAVKRGEWPPTAE